MNQHEGQPRPDQSHPGEQPGKHESADRNDPEVQPGARTGREEPPRVHPEPRRGRGEG